MMEPIEFVYKLYIENPASSNEPHLGLYKVCNPYSMTLLNRSPIFEWYVV